MDIENKTGVVVNEDLGSNISAYCSTNCTINGKVKWWVDATNSNYCTLNGKVELFVLAEYSNHCTVNGKVRWDVWAENSNKLAVGEKFDCKQLFIDPELFLLINTNTMNDRLHPSLKEWALANKQKVYVSISEVYFPWGLAQRVLTQADDMTKEEILNIDNEEQRRITADILGERFAEIMDWELVQEDEYGQLLKTKFGQDYIYCLHCFCSTTNREYWLPVPGTLEEALNMIENGLPEGMEEWTEEDEKAIWKEKTKMETAHQAVAWTFWRSKKEYRPLIQT